MLSLPLVVTIGDSRQRRYTLLAAHTAAVCAVLMANLPLPVHATGLLILLASLTYHWRKNTVVRLRGDAAGILEIWLNQHWHRVHLDDSSVILPMCTVLRLKLDQRWRKLNVVVFPDSLPVEAFRQLRVWLRWRAGKDMLAKPGVTTQAEKSDQ